MKYYYKKMNNCCQKTAENIADNFWFTDVLHIRKAFSNYFCILFYFTIISTAIIVFINSFLILYTYQGYNKIIFQNQQYDEILSQYKKKQNDYLKDLNITGSLQLEDLKQQIKLGGEQKIIKEIDLQFQKKINVQNEYKSYQQFTQLQDKQSLVFENQQIIKEQMNNDENNDRMEEVGRQNKGCLLIRGVRVNDSSSCCYNDIRRCNGEGIRVKLVRTEPKVLEGLGCESRKECELMCSEFLSSPRSSPSIISSTLPPSSSQSQLLQEHIICFQLQFLSSVYLILSPTLTLNSYLFNYSPIPSPSISFLILDQYDPFIFQLSNINHSQLFQKSLPFIITLRIFFTSLGLFSLFLSFILITIYLFKAKNYYLINQSQNNQIQLKLTESNHQSNGDDKFANEIQIETDLDQSIINEQKDNNNIQDWNELESSMMR